MISLEDLDRLLELLNKNNLVCKCDYSFTSDKYIPNAELVIDDYNKITIKEDKFDIKTDKAFILKWAKEITRRENANDKCKYNPAERVFEISKN